MFNIDGKQLLNETKCSEGDGDNDALDQNIGAEDPDNDALVCIAILNDELDDTDMKDLTENKNDMAILVNEQILSEKNIVKLDKFAKKDRAIVQAVLAIAREKNDRDFKKLVTVWKMKKYLIAKLTKKYLGQAKQRVAQNARKMSSSNVASVAKAGKKKK